jgi:hypothetical protein
VDAPGFASTCAPKPVIIRAETQYLNFNLSLRPDGAALRGHVLLADGSPCYHAATTFGTLVFAAVTLTGPHTSITTTGNNRGEFLLAGLPGPGAYSLTAQCQGSQTTQAVTVTPAHLAAKELLDVKLANSPPVLRVLVPKDSAGKVLRMFSPGQTIQVDAEVVDPDRDTLTFKWADGRPEFQSVNSRTISWTLPSAEAQSFLNVEVSDGRGGFAVDQLTVGTSNTGARFIGTLTDPDGKPMPTATVTVDGQPALVDAKSGNFRAAVPVSERHIVTVRQLGHAPVSRIFRDAAPGLKLTLAARV